MNEQLLKTSSADVLSSTRKLRKTLGGDPPPPPLYVVHRIRYFINEKEKRSERLEQVNFR